MGYFEGVSQKHLGGGLVTLLSHVCLPLHDFVNTVTQRAQSSKRKTSGGGKLIYVDVIWAQNLPYALKTLYSGHT